MGALIAEVYGSADRRLSFNSWSKAPNMPLPGAGNGAGPRPGGPAPPTSLLPPSGRVPRTPFGPSMGQGLEFLSSNAHSPHTSMPFDVFPPDTPTRSEEDGLRPFAPSNGPGIYPWLRANFGSPGMPGPNWAGPSATGGPPAPGYASEAYQTSALRLQREGKDPNSWYERFREWMATLRGEGRAQLQQQQAQAQNRPCDQSPAVQGFSRDQARVVTLLFFVALAVFVLVAVDAAFTSALNSMVSPMSRALRTMQQAAAAAGTTAATAATG